MWNVKMKRKRKINSCADEATRGQSVLYLQCQATHVFFTAILLKCTIYEGHLRLIFKSESLINNTISKHLGFRDWSRGIIKWHISKKVFTASLRLAHNIILSISHYMTFPLITLNSHRCGVSILDITTGALPPPNLGTFWRSTFLPLQGCLGSWRWTLKLAVLSP